MNTLATVSAFLLEGKINMYPLYELVFTWFSALCK